ncbi:hypothetical protein JXB41_08055 [Candidatus Woesearchaeota archaeon]|nr:hypothetical protein [Candidatus Woesearchaeota archaeon]
MSLVNHSELKRITGDIKIANEFFPALEDKVEKIIKDAIKRAKANQRTTLMERDV